MKQRTNNLILLIAVLALVILADGVFASRCQIRVRNQVFLGAGPVVFSDIAWVRCDDTVVKERIETMVVGRLAVDARQVHLDNYQLNRVLARAGINPGSVDVYGASSCSVTLKDVPTITAEVAPVAVEPVIEVQGETEKPFTITDLLAREISRSTGCEPDRLVIDWHCREEAILQQPADEVRFTLKRKGPVTLGRVNFEIIDNQPSKIVIKGQVVSASVPSQSYYIQADVKYLTEAIVAQRSITVGQVISSDDLLMVPDPVTDLSRCGMSDPALVIGKEAARTIRANQVIVASMIKKMTLVKRNQQVEVLSRLGRIQLRLKGKAMADGGMGDIITVRTEYQGKSSGSRPGWNPNKDVRLIRGKITGSGQVAVMIPGGHGASNTQYAKSSDGVTVPLTEDDHSIRVVDSLGSN
ncbi:MAG: flagellar basal body P-ring formation chaperone FlgA [Phycisphaerae bacterium]|nr:flagellar basal body P-ring formation chaperone FlgA [Phycisphaerae bacterium]